MALELNERIAIFAATSGHSGVDRVMRNLVMQMDAWGFGVDLLKIRGHGPEVEQQGLVRARVIDLGAAHVNSAFAALVRYLRQQRPRALLTDKDRVNRIAILARAIAGVDTRIVVRLGTTVSVNLADRGMVERMLQRASIRWLYPRAHAVLVPSRGVAKDLVDYAGLASAHIRVVPSPIVTPRLHELAAAPIDHPWLAADEPPVILGVGELGPRKDFATLLRAFARVRAERTCRLIILGRGRKASSLRQLAAELGLVDQVDLPGFHNNPYAFMRRATLFAMSSRWEGMPVALIEALACGTAAVATDCPSGPAEVLAGGDCGALVPIGDDAAMARAIAYWLDVQPTAVALQRAVTDYTIEHSTAAYLNAMGLAETPGKQESP